MKNLIIPVLTELKDSLDAKEFKGQKTLTKSINISSYSLEDLNTYVEKNNIFGGVFCLDEFNDPCYCWSVKVDFTKEELFYKRQKLFNSTSFKKVYDVMIKSGYKRIGLDTIKFRPFRDSSVYSMFVSGDYNRLVSYYSLFFIREGE